MEGVAYEHFYEGAVYTAYELQVAVAPTCIAKSYTCIFSVIYIYILNSALCKLG